MTTKPESLVRIRFTDCDPLGHLNNARYLDYFLNTREDQIREHYGLDFFTIATTEGRSWVVAQNQVAYFRPAKYGDKVWIDSQLFHFDERMLRVEMKMWSEDRTQLKSLIWITLMHVDVKSEKAAAHAPKYMELFGNVLTPMEQANFDQRVKHILHLKKNNGVLAE